MHKRMCNNLYCSAIKRIIDVLFSLAGMIVLSPVILITAAMVRVKLGRPVIFKQKRPGKDEKIFNMYKFRSMTDEKDPAGNLLPDEIRLTGFGKKLRSTSLDELPELFNVLKGDMSLVGPRPQLIRDLVFMSEKQRRRHCVLPGLTGLAQVNGRNYITWEEKFKWDMKYIQNISFRTDAAILIKTVLKVIKREDIQAAGMETSEDLGDYLLRTGKIGPAYYRNQMDKVKVYEGTGKV